MSAMAADIVMVGYGGMGVANVRMWKDVNYSSSEFIFVEKVEETDDVVHTK
jgi:hypothetical protein